MRKETKTFKEQLIYFDEIEYNRAKAQAQTNLNMLNSLIKESVKIIDQPSTLEEMTIFIKNPSKWIYTSIEKKYAKKLNIPVSLDRLITLMDLDLEVLRLDRIVRNYKSNDIKAFTDGIGVDVNKERFKHYTKNEKQNEMLKHVKTFLDSFYKIYEHNTYALNNFYTPQLLNMTRDLLIIQGGKLYPSYIFINKF